MKEILRTTSLFIFSLATLNGLSQSNLDPINPGEKELNPTSSVTLKTAPIRYIYGPNAEMELYLSKNYGIEFGYQYMARDFLAPDVNYQVVDNLGTFSLYDGSGYRVFIGGRYYFDKKYSSPNYFYVGARVFSKTFSTSDSIPLTSKNGYRYSVWYREDQTTIGTQWLFGYKFANWFLKTDLIGELEVFGGLGYYFRERKIAFWTPEGPNQSADFSQDYQKYSSPQITLGLLVGLGL